MIQEYAAEYDALDLERFFKKPENGVIFFEDGMNTFSIGYYGWEDRELNFNVRYDNSGSVKCEPNNVVHYLNEFSAKDVQYYVCDELPTCEVIDILAGIKVIASNFRRQLVPKCHMVEETYAAHLSSDH